MKAVLQNLKMKGEKMRTLGRRLSKLEQESMNRNKKHLLLVEKYPEQPLEGAKEQAGISSENEHEYQVICVSALDAATL